MLRYILFYARENNNVDLVENQRQGQKYATKAIFERIVFRNHAIEYI